MRPSLLWALAASFVFLQASGAGPAPDPAAALSCRVVGIRVVGDTGADPEEWDWEMMPFGAEMGTTLVLALISSRPDVVPLAADVTRLRSFCDGNGADLTAGEPDGGELEFWGLQQELGSERRGAVRLVEVRGENVPSAGSHSVKAEGSITVLVGLKPASQRQDAVPLQKGARITAGPVPFEIVEVTLAGTAEGPEAEGKAAEGAAVMVTDLDHLVDDVDWALGIDEPSVLYGNGELPPGLLGRAFRRPVMTVTLEARQSLDRIEFIELFDGQGKVVEWSDVGRESSISMMAGAETETMVRLKIGLPEKLEKVDVVMHYWGEVREVKVPFSFECGVAVESLAGE